MPTQTKPTANQENGVFGWLRRQPPLKNAIWLILVGITIVFLSLMIQFAFYNPGKYLGNHPFPKWFFFSTVLILLCSFTMERVRKAYRFDNGEHLLNALLITVALGLLFTVTQVLGWYQLWQTQITLSGTPSPVGQSIALKSIEEVERSSSGALLYIMSGLHLLHLLGGLVLLFISMFKAVNVRSDLVKSMLYFSDRRQQTRIDMLVLYWHFLDILWVILFLYFLWFFVQ